MQENTRGDVEVDTRIKMIIFCEYEKYAKVTLFLCKLELDLGSDNYKLIFHCMNIQQDSWKSCETQGDYFCLSHCGTSKVYWVPCTKYPLLQNQTTLPVPSVSRTERYCSLENLWLGHLWEVPLSLHGLSHWEPNPEGQISNIPEKYINLIWKITMKKWV